LRNQVDAPEDIVIAEKVDDKTPGESGGHGLQEQPLDPSEVKEISYHAVTTTAAVSSSSFIEYIWKKTKILNISIT
jgi:hypothetical protein